MKRATPCRTVIAGNNPALAELTDGAAALVEPDDTDALAGWMERSQRDPMWRGLMGNLGQRRAREFTWAKAAAGYAKAYRDAAATVEPLRQAV